MERIDREIVGPIINGLAERGTPYVGLLYPGVMLTEDGPKVLEFNCRFGDPEAPAYVRLIENDLLKVMLAATEGRLDEVPIDWHDNLAVANIILASGGYPGSYEKNKEITGLNGLPDEIVVYHAGTKLNSDGVLVTNGGRVLEVTATGATADEALATAYKAVDKIKFEGRQYRTDIGKAHDNSALGKF